ncbi:Do family serine endopeptidase [Lichenibacterium minor]|uniref:Do family serine endopeptidase n=1 Tax=Lichenibacterium minor TaxID=2316528 RepID=A0A4V1RV89_9HYPH|nr:Do family serine endopeptidase [Lichenibacterium minor]RYC33814.1 Do family serine endopeptidase [Lichenibacterium minor]
MKTRPRAVCLMALPLLLAGAPSRADDRQLPASKADVVLSFAPVVKRVAPAVVNVYASRVEKRPRNSLMDDPIFRQFFGGHDRPGNPTAQSLGSGVVVDASGLVVTNYHVIDGMTDVRVAMSDKKEYPADVVLRDERTDLAVLRLKGAQSLPVMDLGDSDALEVGDIVLAVGDPFGVGQTVTQGIVSGLARSQIGKSDYQYFVQTDAAINPGNSGGALVDMKSRLIGINSAIYSQSGGSVGIGFAIPVNMVKSVISAARAGETHVRRPWLGASLQGITRDMGEALGLDRPAGVLVSDLVDGGPADAAGLKRGDVVTAVDGAPADDPDAFGYRLATKSLGGTAGLTVRRGNQTLALALKLVPPPETPARDAVTLRNDSPFSGATLVNLSPAVAEEMQINGVRAGVVVAAVADNSTAAMTGIQKGDVIVGLDRSKVTSTRQVEKATAARQDFWHVTIQRGGQIIDSELGG